MRRILLLVGLSMAALQAGCGVTPQQLGITGPGTTPARSQTAPDDSTLLPPGLPNPDSGAGGEQRFYRYN